MIRQILSISLIVQFIFSHFASAQNLYRESVSGEAGVDGRNGVSYENEQAYSEKAGRHGGDATDATRGRDAGDINVSLKQTGPAMQGQFVLEGFVRPSDSRSGSRTSVNLSVQNSGYIHLEAKGGKGGDGGMGGSGERGGNGVDGSRATEHQDGGDGTNGGRGGNAGAGTNGAKGGEGGTIRIQVSPEETHLVMLVKSNVQGGQGGDAGKHGKAGRGGSGGSGGASHHWTTYESRTRHTTDAEGNSVQEHYTEPVSHSRSGGSSGSNGSEGSSVGTRLQEGKNGSNGHFIIEVSDGRTKQEYASAFDIEIVDYNLNPLDKNGIYEPARQVEVNKIRIRNRGGMPTPSKMVALVTLANQDWVIAEPTHIELPFSLQPNQEIVLEQPLRFKIKDVVIKKSGARFTHTTATTVQAFQTGAQRYYEGFRDKSFQITFPIEITPITTLKTIAPGEASYVLWEVKNISSRDFGSETDFKRGIITDLKLAGGELPADQLEILDENGRPFETSNAFAKAIMGLGPKGSGRDTAVVKAIVRMKPSAADHSHKSHSLQTRLGLSDEKGNFRDAQFETQEVRVLQYFNSKESLDWLLVINNETTREEVDAWKKLAKSRNRRLDVWDLSNYGILDLQKKIVEDKSLSDLLQGKLVVMLNNNFDPGIGATRGQYFLSQRDFLYSASVRGVHFYIPGDMNQAGSKQLLSRLLVPYGDKQLNEHVDQKEFFEFIRYSWENLIHLKHSNNRVSMDESQVLLDQSLLWIDAKDVRFTPFIEAFSHFKATRHMLWGQPKAKHIQKIAEETGRMLSEYFPERQFVISYEANPEQTNESKYLFFKKWKLGRIEVRRTNDRNLGAAVTVDVKDSQLHSPDFILGLDNFVSIGLAEDFEKSANEFVEHLQGKAWADLHEADREERGRMLADVLLAHIIDDQIMLRTQSMKKNVAANDLEYGLKKMRYLKDVLEKVSLDLIASNEWGGVRKETLLQLMANIEVFERTQKSWWESGISLFYTTQNNAVGKASARLRENILKMMIGSDELNLKTGLYRTLVNRTLEDFKKQYKRQDQNKKTFARKNFSPVQAKKAVTSQTELTREKKNLILTKSEYDDLKQQEDAAQNIQQNLRKAVEAHRSNLSVPPAILRSPVSCEKYFR